MDFFTIFVPTRLAKMKYFVKLAFAAKKLPAPFARVDAPTLPGGFEALKDWAADLDGTAIDTDRSLTAFVEMIASKAAALSGGSSRGMHVKMRGHFIVVYYFAGTNPTYNEITLLFFTVHPVRATVQNGELKLYSNFKP